MARVLLGVSGGIAAYKALELVRRLTAAEHAVRCVMTSAATRFVGPASFAALTGAPVLVDEAEEDPLRGAYPGEPAGAHAPISHLALAHRADVLVVAPATAGTLADLAAGAARGLLGASVLAATCPVLVAPAMNHHMWHHPATRRNLERLRGDGVLVADPGSGRLASRGEAGDGRMAEPAELHAHVEAALAGRGREDVGGDVGVDVASRTGGTRAGDLAGLRVLVSAGGTREPIDAVRFVGNRSSGRMGYALAERAAARGAQVTVIAANVALPDPAGVEVVPVGTAAELATASHARFPACDVLLAAAAVADFRPEPATGKLKRAGRDHLALRLQPTEDVLAALAAARRPGQTLVGFAAEHGDGLAEARHKRAGKGVDAIVLNDVSADGVGFDVPENAVVVVTADDARPVPRAGKGVIADAVLDAVVGLRTAAAAPAGPSPDA